MPEESEEILFEEEQSFRQPWLWALLLGSLVFVVVIFTTVSQQQPNKAGSLVLLGSIVIAVEVGVAVLMFLLKLRVWLDTESLHVRFFPLASKDIPLNEIDRWEARTYSPLAEYGGWGVRYTMQNGTAYNVSGNQGVQLELTSGKRILIGSQRSEELEAAINRAKHVV